MGSHFVSITTFRYIQITDILLSHAQEYERVD